MEKTTRRTAFRLLGGALVAAALAASGEAEAQPYYDPYDRPPPYRPPRDDWDRPRRPPPPDWDRPPPRRCFWRETPWGPRKVCREW
jgi:hypothetical protein